MKLLILLVLYLSYQANADESPPSGGKLVCYAELWAGSRPSPANYDLDDVPTHTCDYLILTYLTLDPNTYTLKMETGYSDVDPEDLRKASRLRAKNPWMKVLVSVGGWEDGVAKYSDMLSEAYRRRAFINSVVETLEKYDFNGLELHWLYPGAVWRGGRAGDKDNYLQLVKELNNEFKPRSWILTASVPPDEENMRNGFNVPRLNRHLQQMHVRTMDMRGDWLGFASNHCPLYSSSWEKPELRNLNVNGSLAMYERAGASPRKLIPTFPFYGRSFTLKDSNRNDPGSPTAGPGAATPFIRAPGLIAYLEICDRLQSKQLTRHFQSGAESPYAVKNDYWVGYEDDESLKKKVKVLIERNNGGAAVFALGMDDFPGTCGRSHVLLHKMRGLLDEGLPFFPDPRQKKP